VWVVFGSAPGLRQVQIAVMIVLEGAVQRVLSGSPRSRDTLRFHVRRKLFLHTKSTVRAIFGCITVVGQSKTGFSTGRPQRLHLRPGRAWIIQSSEILAGKAKAF